MALSQHNKYFQSAAMSRCHYLVQRLAQRPEVTTRRWEQRERKVKRESGEERIKR